MADLKTEYVGESPILPADKVAVRAMIDRRQARGDMTAADWQDAIECLDLDTPALS